MPKAFPNPEPRVVERFATEDGKLFIQRTEAALHQLHLNLTEICRELGLGQGGSWSPDMIAQSLWESRGDLAVIFETATSLEALTK